MKKKILSALLAIVLVVGLVPSALAAETVADQAEVAQVLAALDIMTGDGNGNLNLGGNVTRAEFTKLIMAASVYADSVGPAASTAPYPDVPKNSWAAPYIQVAKEKGLVEGDLHGNFTPERAITLAEGVTMVLRLLGYDKEDFSGKWPSGQMAMYQALKLDKGVSAGQNGSMTRKDAMYLFYNLLTAKNKSGQVYLTTLGHTLTAAGEIDRVALINSAMEGPTVAEAGWQSKIPFDTAKAAVYRGGESSTLASIQDMDVVYWSKPMRTLWAYSNKVTGSIQAITPTASAPTGVKVSGQTYVLETSTATFDLSNLGSFRVGDNVTLLLGRDGGVANLRKAGEISSAALYGVVTELGNQSYQDKDGKTYTAPTVTIAATDGKSHSFQWENKNDRLKLGDLAQVSGGESGFQVTKLSSLSLTGKVSADGTRVGGYDFAADVEILDTYGDASSAKVYPSRLAGVSLKDSMVRYYTLDAQGDIDRMILSDVTGDMHQYGVLTEVTEASYGMALMSSYTYDVGGASRTYASQSSIWNLKTGPCQLKLDGQTVDRIYNLTEVKLNSVSGSQAQGANRTYTLSDSVAVYEQRDKKYYLTDLARVTGGGYTLTGWCDKAESDGGRVRIVIAVAK